MHAGKLRQRITIQSTTPTQNDDGELVDSWAHVLTREPAEVLEVSGGETIKSTVIVATATHLVKIRKRATLTLDETHRIVWRSRVLGVLNARDPDGRGRELWIQAAERKH